MINSAKKYSGYYNTHRRQKKWTKIAVDQFKSGETYSWGESIENENRLGDYMRIKNEYLLPNIVDKTVVEIGCLDGKWSQYIVPCANHSFLVDLSDEILPILNDRFQSRGGGGGIHSIKPKDSSWMESIISQLTLFFQWIR